jgi:hypothetical protein
VENEREAGTIERSCFVIGTPKKEKGKGRNDKNGY